MSPRPVTRARVVNVVNVAAVVSVTVLAAAIAACGDARATAPAPSLPLETVRALVPTLSAVSSVDLGFLLVAPADQDSLAPALRTDAARLRTAGVHAAAEMFTDTLPCPAGGSTIVSGSLDLDDGSGDARLLFLDDWRDCGVDTKGLAWRFTGRPHLRTELLMASGPGEDEETFTGRFTGAVDVVVDTVARRCRFDLTATSTTGGPLRVEGSLCGIPAAALPAPAALRSAAAPAAVRRATAPAAGRPAARSSRGRASPAPSGSRSPAR